MAESGEYKYILAEQRGPVLELWLNRPEARNAMNLAMEAELCTALDRADDDPDIKVVTLRGKGAVFSAGHDLKEAAARRASGAVPRAGRRPAQWPLHRHRLDPVGERAWYCRKTLIAGVHGYVGPASWTILEAFDFVLAAEDTRFSREQARLGSGAPGGYITPFLFPMRVMNQLWLLGGWMTAQTARELHFVQRVVSDVNELDTEITRWADAACALSVAQIAAHKESIHRRYEIMGLTGIVSIGNQQAGSEAGPGPGNTEFSKVVETSGLHQALRLRDQDVDPTVTEI